MRLLNFRLNYVSIKCEWNKSQVEKCELKKCESKIWVKNLSKKSEKKYMTVKYE